MAAITPKFIATLVEDCSEITPNIRASILTLLSASSTTERAFEVNPDNEITEAQAAKRLGVSRSQLSRWRNGKTIPAAKSRGLAPATNLDLSAFPMRFRRAVNGSIRYYAPDVDLICRAGYADINTKPKAAAA